MNLVRKAFSETMTSLNRICVQVDFICKLQLGCVACVKWTHRKWTFRPHNFSHMQFIIGVLQKFTHNKMCTRIQARKIGAFVVVLLMSAVGSRACTFGQYWNACARVYGFIDGNICVPMLWKFGRFQSLSLCGWCQRWTRFFTVSRCLLSDVTQNTFIRNSDTLTNTLSPSHCYYLLLSVTISVHWIDLFLSVSFVLNSYFDFCLSFLFFSFDFIATI